MGKKREQIEFSINGIATTTDLVEVHILKELEILKTQNKRYRLQLEKSSENLNLKPISSWKPSDFFKYFCNKFEDKYNKQYKNYGNIVSAYRKIEAFVKGNNISNEKYKEFIDVAFNRCFNAFIMPVVAHMYSYSLYNKLMDCSTRKMTRDDVNSLDQIIMNENEKFKKLREEEGRVTYESLGWD